MSFIYTKLNPTEVNRFCEVLKKDATEWTPEEITTVILFMEAVRITYKTAQQIKKLKEKGERSC